MFEGNGQMRRARLRPVPLAIAVAMAVLLVAGDALASPANARRTRRDGAELRHLRRGRQTIVSWLRAGHTCVLSAVGPRSDELLKLAAWNGSIDIARIHPGLLPPLAPAVHRLAP